VTVRILLGDSRSAVSHFAEGSVQCCVTSPPYYGLRDYGAADQIGLEQTPEAYIAELVSVFAQVKRALRDDGTLWLNLGDSYNGGGLGGGSSKGEGLSGSSNRERQTEVRKTLKVASAKPKDLLGIPWMLAFALREDGWYLRQDIIWHKPNPMPESVTDRPTSAHEHVFLLTKRGRYFYDAEAIAENAALGARRFNGGHDVGPDRNDNGRSDPSSIETRNARNVWTIASQAYGGAHFATMPPELVERCIKAGTKKGDLVLDPFSGAGTTALVADRLGRNAVGIEINPEYADLSRERIRGDAGMFGEIA
jgi:DNA modification methylase